MLKFGRKCRAPREMVCVGAGADHGGHAAIRSTLTPQPAPERASNHTRRADGPSAWSSNPKHRSTHKVNIRELCTGTKWVAALKTHLLVMKNAAGSIACAWLVNACYLLGNIFSGKLSREQSRSDLTVSNPAWSAISFYTITLLAHVSFVMSLRFLDAPDCRPTFWFCLKKLLRRTAVYFVAMVAVILAAGCFAAYLATVEPGIFKYKIECYVGTLSIHGFLTGITLETKKIYYQETRQGRDEILILEQKANTPVNKALAAAGLQGTATRVPRKPRFRFWRMYWQEFPRSLSAALAGVFVHVLSQQRIVDRGTTAVTCFIVATILFNLTVQETIKHCILKKKRIRSTRSGPADSHD
jgi:hypothetical protein